MGDRMGARRVASRGSADGVRQRPVRLCGAGSMQAILCGGAPRPSAGCSQRGVADCRRPMVPPVRYRVRQHAGDPRRRRRGRSTGRCWPLRVAGSRLTMCDHVGRTTRSRGAGGQSSAKASRPIDPATLATARVGAAGGRRSTVSRDNVLDGRAIAMARDSVRSDRAIERRAGGSLPGRRSARARQSGRGRERSVSTQE